MARLTLDWTQLAAALGALQGMLLAAVLATQRRNRTANRLLAVLMACFTVALASSVYYTEPALVRQWPHVFGVSYPLPWVFGPLVYLYAVAASDRDWRVGPRTLLHFLPVLAVILAGMRVYTLTGPEKLALYERLLAGGEPPLPAWLDGTKYLSGVGYSIATIAALHVHRRRIEESYSNTTRVDLSWLLRLAGASAAIWLLAVVVKVVGGGTPMRDEHVALAMALLVYAIGYMGLRQPEVFRWATAEWPVPARAGIAPVPPPPAAEPRPRYERSGLGEREAGELKASLLGCMVDEEPWRDSELTLADLAVRLGTTPHKLSEVLNAQVGQTFYDFVNAYRVREVQRRIEAGDAHRLKMLALAYDAGFASKSTFNAAFRKHTSRTPSDYRETVGA